MIILTIVYAFSTVVFIPILFCYMKEVDAQHTIVINHEKDKYRQEQFKLLLKQQIALRFQKKDAKNQRVSKEVYSAHQSNSLE